jgi:hypothetical protein
VPILIFFLIATQFFQLNDSQVFTYDVATLIELVESKPCLWDKTSDISKDKIEKWKAWREISTFLEGDFHQMQTKKKNKYTFISTF